MSRYLNLGSFLTLQKNVTTQGTPLKLSPHIVATTIAFNEVGATGDTITDSGNGLLNAGFVAGDFIQVTGSGSNNGNYQIKTIVAGTITVEDTDDLVNEVAGSSVTITKIASKTDTTEPGIPVPDGVEVVIKAKKANAGDITIGFSSASALNTASKHFKLDAGEAAELNVSNLKLVWLDTNSSGDGVEVILET